jgi:hypothetical protein
MSRQLIWDAAPGEVRCALLEDGVPVALHLIRSCRAAPTADAGTRAAARLISRLGNGRALIQLETGEEALLSPVPPVAEGARLFVEIVRSRVPEPGRWKRALARPADREGATTGLRAVLLADADEILCGTMAAAQDLSDAGVPVRLAPEAVAAVDFETLLDAARTGLIPFDGGELCIERTRAMTMIDVDGTLDPLSLNCAAAAAIGRVLRLFDIQGPIGIDFVGMASRADRQAVDQALAAACAPLGPQERTAINGYGFAQIIRPRTGPSIPELLCGPTPGRLSVESMALSLLRQAARSQGVGTRTITAPSSVIDLLRQWPAALDAVRRETGADVTLACDAASNGYGHVHVSPA